MNPEYTVGPLPPVEAQALTAELTALLEKYDAEIQVTSQMVLVKRIRPVGSTEPRGSGIVSPLQHEDLDKGKEGGGFIGA